MRRFRCPRCRKIINVADSHAEPALTCPSCQTRIRMPKAGSPGSSPSLLVTSLPSTPLDKPGGDRPKMVDTQIEGSTMAAAPGVLVELSGGKAGGGPVTSPTMIGAALEPVGIPGEDATPVPTAAAGSPPGRGIDPDGPARVSQSRAVNNSAAVSGQRVKLRCAKCGTVFLNPGRILKSVSCPKCGAGIRAMTSQTPSGSGSGPAVKAGASGVRQNSGSGAAVRVAKPGSGSQRPASASGSSGIRSRPGSKGKAPVPPPGGDAAAVVLNDPRSSGARRAGQRTGLNPMTDTFLDKLEALNRSASGLDLLATGEPTSPSGRWFAPGEGGEGGGKGAGGERSAPRKSGGIPTWALWAGGVVLAVLAAVGAVASVLFLVK